MCVCVGVIIYNQDLKKYILAKSGPKSIELSPRLGFESPRSSKEWSL